MRNLRLAVGSCLVAFALGAAPRDARAQESDYGNVAMQRSRGLALTLGPTLVFPLRSEGPYGAGLTIDGQYGIQLGPTVVAPGARVGGYVVGKRGVGVGMLTARVIVPVGPLAPYGIGGVGVGGLSNDNETGAALLGGGGIMIHVSKVVAFGAEATYQVIPNTELKTLVVTPAISLGE